MISRAVTLSDLQNNYNWNSHIFEVTTQENLLQFLKSKIKIIGTDKNFKVPLFIDYITLDCILIYKDGRKELSRYDHIFKGNVFKFETKTSFRSFNQLKSKLEFIVFLDGFEYHETFREFWNEDGLSGKVYQHKESFLNGLLGEL